MNNQWNQMPPNMPSQQRPPMPPNMPPQQRQPMPPNMPPAAETADAAEYAATTGKNATAGAFSGR